MVAVSGAMLQIPHNEGVVWTASMFTFVSGVDYEIREIRRSSHSEAKPHP